MKANRNNNESKSRAVANNVNRRNTNSVDTLQFVNTSIGVLQKQADSVEEGLKEGKHKENSTETKANIPNFLTQFRTVQKQADLEEEGLQQGKLKEKNAEAKPNTPNFLTQFRTKQGSVDSGEDLLQGKFKENNTGLPDNLKSGIENLSGYSMDDVKVHYNSKKPAQFHAHAYAQGTNIHLAPGEEKHLPHEAWHVVQQKQGRVKPTRQMEGEVKMNDDAGLENEADNMGAEALQMKPAENSKQKSPLDNQQHIAQFRTLNQAKNTDSRVIQAVLSSELRDVLELDSPLIQLQKTNACWFLSVLFGMHGQGWIQNLFETGAIEIVERNAETLSWKSEGASGTLTLGSTKRHRPVWQQIIESKITQVLPEAPFLAKATTAVPSDQFQKRMQAIGMGSRGNLQEWVNSLVQAIHSDFALNDVKSSPPITAGGEAGAIGGIPPADGTSISVLTTEKRGHAMSVAKMSQEKKGKRKIDVYNQQIQDKPDASYTMKAGDSQVKSNSKSPNWAKDLDTFNRYDLTRNSGLVPSSEVEVLESKAPEVELNQIEEDTQEEVAQKKKTFQLKHAQHLSNTMQLVHNNANVPVIQKMTPAEIRELDKDKQEKIKEFAKASGINVSVFKNYTKWLAKYSNVEAIEKAMKKGVVQEEKTAPTADKEVIDFQIKFIKELQNNLKSMLDSILTKVGQAKTEKNDAVLAYVNGKIKEWLPGKGSPENYEQIEPQLSALMENIDKVSISFLDAIEGGIANAEARNRIIGTQYPGIADMEGESAKEASVSATVTLARYNKPKGHKKFQQLLPRSQDELSKFEPRRLWTLLHESTHAILGTADVKKVTKGAAYSADTASLSPKNMTKQNKGPEFKNADSWTALIFQLYLWLNTPLAKAEQEGEKAHK